MQNYQQLEERFAEIHKLDSIGSVLFWDSKVMMPATASANRGEQMGTLTRVIHGKRTDPALADLLAAADNEQPQAPISGGWLTARSVHQTLADDQ